MMVQKLFLYTGAGVNGTDGINNSIVNYFNSKLYTCIELTDRERFFWDQLDDLDNGGTLVLCTHGDNDGPLLVSGNGGGDMHWEQIQTLANRFLNPPSKLYLLSCHTGQDPFCIALSTAGAQFVAPKGIARVGVGEISSFKSQEYVRGGWTDAGWSGPLVRRGSALLIE